MSVTISPYRPDIDGVRAIAILAVVGFHAFPGAIPGGFVGVDVFFVISGYLITGLIQSDISENRFSLALFYSRRVRRLFPALLTVFLSLLIYGWLRLRGEEYKSLAAEVFAGGLFFPNLYFLYTANYFNQIRTEFHPFLHLWSLGVEEQFYFFWPLMLTFLAAIRKGYRYSLIALTILVLCSFILNVAIVTDFKNAAYYLPLTRIWELGAGGVLAYWTKAGAAQGVSKFELDHKTVRFVRDLQSVAGLSLIVAAVFLVDRSIPFPGWAALMPVAGTCMIIAAGPDAWVNRSVLSQRAAVIIGLISYPLYLWHWPILAILRLDALDYPSRWARLAGVLLAFALAYVTYRLIEQPVYRKMAGRQQRPDRVYVIPGLILGMLLCVGLSAYIHQRDGAVFRHDEQIRWLSYYPYKYDGLFRSGKEYRFRRCFLALSQSPEEYAGECADAGFDGARQSVLIWGDSHAAALYPGLRARQGSSDYRLAQYTAAGCPPLRRPSMPGLAGSYCREKYDFALARIKTLSPKTVVIAARWQDSYTSFLAETIADLKRLGVSQIAIIGPLPRWRWGLPATLWRWYQAHQAIPDTMSFGLDRNIWAIDGALEDLADATGVVYISPLELVCHEGACLTRTGNRPEDLFASDDAHLTLSGSNYLVGSIIDAGLLDLAANAVGERSR